MMEIEAGLYNVAPAGSVLRLPKSRQERTCYSPPYPSAHLFIHTLHGNLQCTGQQWAGRRINGFTSMYIQEQ
jgi:hypothetical protein